MGTSLSVIIPVYNCERFIEKTIASVLAQPEVTEIVIVDDGSTDGSLDIIKQLQQDHPIIQVCQHPNGKNRGRSATRNLGIQNAMGDYIAFLDADDYYLPNRFDNDFKIFAANAACDGVYNAVGFHYYRDITINDDDANKLDTVNCKIKSENLFDALLHGKYGHFHIDGLTIKKKIFSVTGLFNEELVVAEDTDLLWKMAIKFRLESGIIDEALAKRGIHDANVFNRVDLYKIYTMKMYESILKWCSKNKVAYKIQDELLKRIWIVKQKENNRLFADIKYWFNLFVPNANLFFSILSIKYFPIIRCRQLLFPFLYYQF
jgi:glycosyltransferase involved in cell wall biosynthesis